ncbi:hypothetical protein ACCQ05_19830 [Xanthomonas sp. NCPPB 3582]|uniref:hypothetical protein n=1 Tax=Xanthomonas sp. NCPPB 3582 TaxID=487557 RepID=UPI00355672D3
MSNNYVVKITSPGPRPEFYRIAEYLWGVGCNIDSDGDSSSADDRSWTELSLSLRGSPGQYLDIDPISLEPLVLAIRSPQESLCAKAAEFIVFYSGGIAESLAPTNSSKPNPLRGSA